MVTVVEMVGILSLPYEIHMEIASHFWPDPGKLHIQCGPWRTVNQFGAIIETCTTLRSIYCAILEHPVVVLLTNATPSFIRDSIYPRYQRQAFLGSLQLFFKFAPLSSVDNVLSRIQVLTRKGRSESTLKISHEDAVLYLLEHKRRANKLSQVQHLFRLLSDHTRRLHLLEWVTWYWDCRIKRCYLSPDRLDQLWKTGKLLKEADKKKKERTPFYENFTHYATLNCFLEVLGVALPGTAFPLGGDFLGPLSGSYLAKEAENCHEHSVRLLLDLGAVAHINGPHPEVINDADCRPAIVRLLDFVSGNKFRKDCRAPECMAAEAFRIFKILVVARADIRPFHTEQKDCRKFCHTLGCVEQMEAEFGPDLPEQNVFRFFLKIRDSGQKWPNNFRTDALDFLAKRGICIQFESWHDARG
ncbi:hypothetical protein BJ508DRAFT_342562 [Ascobolus immersus RN42]|uniref:Uncharacterized protein n=1 Tax=Ascobolus immersus RN42 TaxID=1160509 RepID=A0A3N4IBF8_ASCIM|nr:hypothetical protein BJ508DRAFT_342562 [Ascobolus immersus RN42]